MGLAVRRNYMILKWIVKTEWYGVVLIHMTQDRGQWPATVMDIQAP